MFTVGITGGIGAGKSTVAQAFATFGIPILDADAVAKHLMENDKELQQHIIATFGKECFYKSGRLNRSFLAQVAFSDDAKRNQLNALVHPVTIAYAKSWAEQQTTPYVIKESALFFESGSFRNVDFMIGVSAPEKLRRKRVSERSHLSDEEISQRMSSQMDEGEKMKKCDAVITNDGEQSLIHQVMPLHEKILNLAAEKSKK